jgi:TM2 domain-containing membrane protein YozV
MALITCPDCGRAVSDLAYECPGCGRPMDEERRELTTQSSSGRALSHGGTGRALTTSAHSDKNKGTATMLSLLLGGLGIHRFYLGRPVSGLFYFLFCWTFIPLVISWVEFARLVFMDEKEFHDRYRRPDPDGPPQSWP